MKAYAELQDKFIDVLKDFARHYKVLDIIKEGLTREWASPEEFEKWQIEKMKELFKDEEK